MSRTVSSRHTCSRSRLPPGFDALGDLLKPTLPTHAAPPPPQVAIHPGGKLLANDLDSSLANLVGSECPNRQGSEQKDPRDQNALLSHLLSASFPPQTCSSEELQPRSECLYVEFRFLEQSGSVFWQPRHRQDVSC